MTTRGLEFKHENVVEREPTFMFSPWHACPHPPQNALSKNSTGNFRMKTNRLWWFGLGTALAHREQHYWEV